MKKNIGKGSFCFKSAKKSPILKKQEKQ